MKRFAVVGLGKMGLSHLAVINAHADAEVVAIVDSTAYVLDTIAKYTGLQPYSDYERMLNEARPDAVLIATPTRLHTPMVRSALERGMHVFCEKPLALSASDSLEFAATAAVKGVVTQVGYHNRFVGSFREVKRLLDVGAIGRVSHILAEAYGPVVLRTKGGTWRSQRNEGGGSLYDYAAHPLDLVSWYLGAPRAVGGTVLGSVFSGETDDEVFGTLFYASGASAQISVNWSDESFRKMSTKITVFGSAGRIEADRQEVQVYLRESAGEVQGYQQGWNAKYTTELTDPVWFYLRGEEYSAQLDYFVRRVHDPALPPINDFGSAATTDQTIGMLVADATAGPSTKSDHEEMEPIRRTPRRAGLLRRRG